MRNWFEILILALIWCGFSNDFSLTNVFFALVISSLIVISINRKNKLYFRVNLFRLFHLLLLILYELIKSSIEVTIEVLNFSNKRSSELLHIPLACKNDFQKTLLFNLISLTPGTLSVDLSANKDELLVHVMFANKRNKIIKFIKEKLEVNIMRAFYVR